MSRAPVHRHPRPAPRAPARGCRRSPPARSRSSCSSSSSYFAYTKANPFDDPYELNFVVRSANELKQRSPVRVAGVEVGKVTEVEPIPSDERDLLPEHADESYARVDDADRRRRGASDQGGRHDQDPQPDLPRGQLLRRAPSGQPVAPRSSRPARRFRRTRPTSRRSSTRCSRTSCAATSARTSGSSSTSSRPRSRARARPASTRPSATGSARTATARRSPRRTSAPRTTTSRACSRARARCSARSSRNEDALKGFVTNLNRTVAAFAVQEDNLKATIPQLRDVLKVGRPALQSLNSALPSLRAFAREALPGTRAASPTLDAQIPLVRQLRAARVGGRAAGARRTTCATRSRTSSSSTRARRRPSATRARSRRARTTCSSRSRRSRSPIPTSRATTPTTTTPASPGTSSSSARSSGSRARAACSTATRRSSACRPAAGPAQLVTTGETGEDYFSRQLFPIEGVRPISPLADSTGRSSGPTSRASCRRCPTCTPRTATPAEDADQPADRPQRPGDAGARRRRRSSSGRSSPTTCAARRSGQPTFDPLVYKGPLEKEMLDKLGLIRLDNGKLAERGGRAK